MNAIHDYYRVFKYRISSLGIVLRISVDFEITYTLEPHKQPELLPEHATQCNNLQMTIRI